MGVRTYPDLPRVYVDMDGVIAAFEAAARARGITPAQLKLQRGAYLGLQVIPGAKEALRDLAQLDVDIFVLTKIPSGNVYAATEKLLWIERHFPELHDRVIITSDKGCVGKERDFLIDDHPEWANADQFPGTIITFTGDWPSVVELIRFALYVRQAVASAFDPAASSIVPPPSPAAPPEPVALPTSRFRAGMWIANAHRLGRVRYVHPDGTLDIVLFERDGRQIGRVSPAMGGPRGFEPSCSPEGWAEIARPAFPMNKFAFLHDLVEPADPLRA